MLISDFFKVVLIDDIWFHSSFCFMVFCGLFWSLTVTATMSDHADMFEVVLNGVIDLFVANLLILPSMCS